MRQAKQNKVKNEIIHDDELKDSIPEIVRNVYIEKLNPSTFISYKNKKYLELYSDSDVSITNGIVTRINTGTIVTLPLDTVAIISLSDELVQRGVVMLNNPIVFNDYLEITLVTTTPLMDYIEVKQKTKVANVYFLNNSAVTFVDK